MKKVILLFILILSTDLLMSEAFQLERSGEWAAYQDTRGDYDFFRAYWGHNIDGGGLIFFIKNIDNRTKENINYMLQLKKSFEDGFEIEQINGISEDQPPGFKQSITDVLNFIDISSEYKPADKEKNLRRTAPGYVEVFHFKYHLPLFGFDSISFEGNEPSYKLSAAGMFGIDDIQPFFELKPSGELQSKERRALGIPEKEIFEAELYDYNILLDSNWTPNDELGYPGYWLSVYSYRDSQIMLEKVKWEDMQNSGIECVEEFIRKTLYLPGDRVFMDTMTLKSAGTENVLSYYLSDSNNNYNYVRRTVWIDDELLYILNFSSFADIYSQNIDYYEKILDSFKRIDAGS
jgi:hypothetical protein